MDKKQNIGVVLLMLLILGYMWYSKPTEEEIQEKRRAMELAEQKENEGKVTPNTEIIPSINNDIVDNNNQKNSNPTQTNNLSLPDSIQNLINQRDYGLFSSLLKGEKRELTLENNLLAVDFTTEGGKIQKVLLKQYLTYDKAPLILTDMNSIQQHLNIRHQHKDINLYQLYFSKTRQYQSADSTFLELSAVLSNGKEISQTYSLAKDSYIINYKLDIQNIRSDIEDEKHLTWEMKYKRIEEHIEGVLGARKQSGINFYTQDGEFDTIGETSETEEEATTEIPVKWISFKQKYFNSSIISKQGEFLSANLKMNPTMDKDTTYIKTVYVDLSLANNQFKNGIAEFQYYFGPNNYKILSDIETAPDINKNVYLGWVIFAGVNKWLIIPLFDFLESYFSNYGIIILLLVFIVKSVLSPLSYKSYVSMAKMRVLKPELDEIKEKHAGNQQKQQQEQMKLYGQFGISPLSGCIPMLLQMPILLAMFYFFPNAVALRQESFLWSQDLSTYDDVIKLGFELPFIGSHLSLFTILMTVSSLLYTWMNNQLSNVSGPMKNIGYIAPIIFFFVLNSYPAGLTFYYFVSNIVTFSQQAIIKRTINETKIREKLEINKKKNVSKKKSGWRLRLEEAMKTQQEASQRKKQKK